MKSKQFYEPEQDLDIEVRPGKDITFIVNLDETARNGAAVELPAGLVEQLITAWRQAEEK